MQQSWYYSRIRVCPDLIQSSIRGPRGAAQDCTSGPGSRLVGTPGQRRVLRQAKELSLDSPRASIGPPEDSWETPEASSDLGRVPKSFPEGSSEPPGGFPCPFLEHPKAFLKIPGSLRRLSLDFGASEKLSGTPGEVQEEHPEASRSRSGALQRASRPYGKPVLKASRFPGTFQATRELSGQSGTCGVPQRAVNRLRLVRWIRGPSQQFAPRHLGRSDHEVGDIVGGPHCHSRLVHAVATLITCMRCDSHHILPSQSFSVYKESP